MTRADGHRAKAPPEASVERRIRDILVLRLGVGNELLAQCDSRAPLLGRGVGLDSVEAMALAAGIEEEFGIEIPDDELTVDLFQNLATLVEYVRSRIEQTQDRP